MLYYIVVFIVSLWATNQADKSYKRRNEYILFSFIAVLPPILLAGLRGPTVGSDTEQYIEEIFNLACLADNFESFRERTGGGEVLYMLLNYIVSRFTNNPIYVQTLSHIFVILPVYKVAMLWRKKVSPVYVMLFFYCICYQESLSTVRQSIAMSLSFLAIVLFIDKKYKKYIFWTLASFGFHMSAFVPLLFPALYYISIKYPFKRHFLTYSIIVVAIVYVISHIDNYLGVLLNSGLISARYAIYSSAYSDFDEGLGITNIIVKILTVAYFTYIVFRADNDYLLNFFFWIAIVDLLLSLGGAAISPIQRLAYYARIISCVSIPYVFTKYPIYSLFNDRRIKVPMGLFFSILLIFFWYYVYMHGDMDSTFEYTFASII